jgi:translation initiation factor IF-2
MDLAKMRVYEYAKKVNKSSKEILHSLKDLGIQVNNHMSVLDEGMIQKLDQRLNQQEKSAKDQDRPQSEENKKSPSNGNHRNKQESSAHNKKRASSGSNRNSQRNQAARGQEERKTNHETSQQEKRQRKGKKGKAFQKGKDGARRDHVNRKGKGRQKGEKKKETKEKQAPVLPKEITVSGPMTVGDFAKLLRRESSAVIKKLITLGIMATINQEIDVETMAILAEEFDVTIHVKEEVDESNFEEIEETDAPEDLLERPPVVTIMGHVDHGKTTLLDKIRQSKITEEEAGGITQHIGAYQIEANDKKITFLDTPGHAAFTTMRARGAQVTDITILVVAADDGVMPQTVEAINHAKAADVPIIVAVNKMDKPEANPDRVKQQLTEYGLVPEEWGGDTIFVPVSALTGDGIDELLEMILLVAEVQELKANPDKRARGVVIEAELDKGRGAVATVLVQNGTLHVGDPVVAGNYFGKIRAMINDQGRRVKTAPPSTPVEILGLSDVPNAGDAFMVFEDEKKARSIAEKRQTRQKEQERGAHSRVSLDDLFKQIKEGEVKELNVIIKADVHGSAEAMKHSLEKIDVEGARVKIIHAAVGAITESDIILASASNAIVIGFNVRPEPNAREMAKQEKVDIRLHRVIYKAIEEIEAAMKGLLDPEYEEVMAGIAEVRQIFKVSRIGTIAGCYVTEGKVVRDGKARVIRDGVVIHEGEIDTLKRYKDDAKEVAQGYECGITLQNYNDIKEGDQIEVYTIQEVERK